MARVVQPGASLAGNESLLASPTISMAASVPEASGRSPGAAPAPASVPA